MHVRRPPSMIRGIHPFDIDVLASALLWIQPCCDYIRWPQNMLFHSCDTPAIVTVFLFM